MREKILQLKLEGKTLEEISIIVNRSITTIRSYLNDKRRKSSIKRIAEHRIRIKRKAIDYSGGSCIKCGYNKCNDALVFHHIDPHEKESGIANGDTRSWSRILNEINKTIILCATCHIEYHAGMWNITNEYEKQMEIRNNYIDKPLFRYGTDIILSNKIIIPKPINKCICGKMVLNKKFCSIQCAHFAARKIIWPDNLRELIKKSSQRQVAKILGVSDKAVYKHLKVNKL